MELLGKGKGGMIIASGDNVGIIQSGERAGDSGACRVRESSPKMKVLCKNAG